MKVAVYGAGAIGGWLAHRLASAGTPTAVIARGAHLAAIRAQGLAFEDGAGRSAVRVEASDDPAAIGPVDLVIYGVKAHQLGGALAASGPLIGAETLALTTQNGVDAPERVAEVFGPARTVIGVARVSAEIVAPGVIGEFVDVRGLLVGGFDGRPDDPAALRVREVLGAAGVNLPAIEDARAELWAKFVQWNATSATVTARLPAAAMHACPELKALAVSLAQEAVAVGAAQGAPVTEAMWRRIAEAKGPGRPGIRASMLVDLEAGKPLELDHLVGAVARLGTEAGVPVPASAAVTAVLAPHRDGRPGG